MYKYNIFISHSWSYNEQYEKIKALLDNRPYFTYRDYSIPENSKVIGTRKVVWEEIESSIKMSSVLIVPAAMYVGYSDSIKKELDLAKKYNKKIIAIKPQNQTNFPKEITDKADKIIGWQAEALVKAIREL